MIELERATKIFKLGSQKVEAMVDLNLKIAEGDFAAVMGASGSGKTTLLNIIGGLDYLTSGHAYYKGIDLADMDDQELPEYRNRVVGFVFQSFNLLSVYTALENVMLPMIWSGRKRSERKDRARELLKIVGLEKRMAFRPVHLSGGERQRVSIARALANEPEIILADEPTGNLDSKTGTEVMDILAEINRSAKVTMIMVTHDVAISKRAKRVIKMKDGRIVR